MSHDTRRRSRHASHIRQHERVKGHITTRHIDRLYRQLEAERRSLFTPPPVDAMKSAPKIQRQKITMRDVVRNVLAVA